MTDPLEGQISHYRILAPLGAGGMGAVYRAHDESLGRDVALKVLLERDLNDANARTRLIREAQMASSLNHPNIAHIYEVGEDRGQMFIAMELVEGRTLQSAIPPAGMTPDAILRLGAQMADALGHAHAHGVVHRDLKSTNVMLTPEGRVKILDFGLAKRLEPTDATATTRDLGLTEPGMVMGTPNHLAPEVLRGAEADARSDLWALGVVLYEMASGRVPFSGGTLADLAAAIVGREPEPLSARIPTGVQMVISRCLAKEPSRRYARAGDVAAALEALRGSSTTQPALGRGPRIAIAVTGVLVIALIAALMWLPGGARNWFGGAAGGHPEIRSLAVLPLANLSGDPSQDYFADGMTEELITDLAPTPSLKVISRTSVMRFRNTRLTVPQIAKELGVDAVVEGSVMRVGGKVRVTAQLIHAATDQHLWAQSFERDFREVLTLQSEVAREITKEIQLKLTPAVSAKLAKRPLVDPRVYDLDLKGRFEWNQATEASLERSIHYFEQALAIDPNDARALSGLADAYLLRTQVIGNLDPVEGMARVQEYARRATEADPNSAEAHATLAASLLFGDWNWRDADREVVRALEINPGYAAGRLVHAVVLAVEGRVAEAIAENQKALELDPYSQLNMWHGLITLRASRRYEEAEALARRAREIYPDSEILQEAQVRLDEQRGRFDKAIESITRMLAEAPDGAEWSRKLKEAYARQGPPGYWQTAIDFIRSSPRAPGDQAMALAHMYAGLKDRDNTLAQLERAYEYRGSDLLFMKVEPFFGFLKDDPRFVALAKKVGLP